MRYNNIPKYVVGVVLVGSAVAALSNAAYIKLVDQGLNDGKAIAIDDLRNELMIHTDCLRENACRVMEPSKRDSLLQEAKTIDYIISGLPDFKKREVK